MSVLFMDRTEIQHGLLGTETHKAKIRQRKSVFSNFSLVLLALVVFISYSYYYLLLFFFTQLPTFRNVFPPVDMPDHALGFIYRFQMVTVEFIGLVYV